MIQWGRISDQNSGGNTVVEGTGGLHWGRFNKDYRVYFGMEVLFDLGAYDTKQQSDQWPKKLS
ncbi:hypothetical protein [Spartinivicinus ruber]|uniref:hypothetical protein n=1 Tax=Spartinivicinus ruber TaxID=2683272 RepID=UPI0013D7D1FD|nr:hypothetical protein [Spartinivicinus ruber]